MMWKARLPICSQSPYPLSTGERGDYGTDYRDVEGNCLRTI
jgi:hypothetical protein